MSSQFYDYDVFISHAIEDKISIGNELYERLQAAGFRVWFAGSEFRYGDSVQLAINEGLSKSRYGIILITRNYISKSFDTIDFEAVLSERRGGEKVLIPLIHGILEEKTISLELEGTITSKNGMELILEKLITQIKTDERLVKA